MTKRIGTKMAEIVNTLETLAKSSVDKSATPQFVPPKGVSDISEI